eukprot:TRINITY_DN5695_c0_g1_i2.p1 TRINITY_DN5695_c0_g1~~TRINITY_DN5695_c0_g1_i2.p1  ORF type:complete len:511 (-),score=81.58 TRINITY_DN5695_c0_g1_i2:212-1621(-)
MAARGPAVVVIGAGLGGVLAAIQLRRAGVSRIVLLEQAASLGGTWRDNVYPGAAVDIESVFYSYSFAPNPHWTRDWASQPELLSYIQRTARDYGVESLIRFNARVTVLRWTGSYWRVFFNNPQEGQSAISEIAADVVITAVGQMSVPRTPELSGSTTFQGRAFHSARWDPACTLSYLRGRKVAVVGNAASAVQIVPEVGRVAAQLTVFQRSPTYIAPRRENDQVPQWMQHVYAWVPLAQKLVRAYRFWQRDFKFSVFWAGSRAGVAQTKALQAHLARTVADSRLRAKLSPQYPVGCKRTVVASGFLEMLQEPHVELVTEEIARLTETGIVTADGRERAADVIIYATGFATTEFLHGIRVFGEDGVSLHQVWGGSPHALHGIAVSGFPNLFMLYGPNTSPGSSILFMMECQMDYILWLLQSMVAHNLRSLSPSPEAQGRYHKQLRWLLDQSVWSSPLCTSWFKNAHGVVV